MTRTPLLPSLLYTLVCNVRHPRVLCSALKRVFKHCSSTCELGMHTKFINFIYVFKEEPHTNIKDLPKVQGKRLHRQW